jgi:hypothetical protein
MTIAMYEYLHVFDGKFNNPYVLSYSTEIRNVLGQRKQKGKIPIKTQAATQPVPYNTTKGKNLKLVLMYVHR